MELTPEIALDFLRNNGYVVKAWCKEDIESVLEDTHPEFMAGRRDEIANKVIEESRYWQMLADCTDGDWLTVDMAIDEVLN